MRKLGLPLALALTTVPTAAEAFLNGHNDVMSVAGPDADKVLSGVKKQVAGCTGVGVSPNNERINNPGERTIFASTEVSISSPDGRACLDAVVAEANEQFRRTFEDCTAMSSVDRLLVSCPPHHSSNQ